MISPTQRPLPYNTQQKHPCPQRDSNSQYQQASGRRPTPYTATPLASAEWRWTIGEPKKLIKLRQCQSLCSHTYLHKIIRQSAVRSQCLAPLNSGYATFIYSHNTVIEGARCRAQPPSSHTERDSARLKMSGTKTRALSPTGSRFAADCTENSN